MKNDKGSWRVKGKAKLDSDEIIASIPDVVCDSSFATDPREYYGEDACELMDHIHKQLGWGLLYCGHLHYDDGFAGQLEEVRRLATWWTENYMYLRNYDDKEAQNKMLAHFLAQCWNCTENLC